MSMKKHLAMISIMAAMTGGFGVQSNRRESTGNGFGEGNKPPIPKGCQEYHFGDYSCIASSEKSANKKYQKFLSKNK